MKTKTLVRLAVYVAIAAILGWVESLLPPLFAFAPGVKLGLGNLVVLLALVTMGAWQSAVVLLAKCLFGALYGGNFFGLLYSVSGGIVGLAASILVYYTAGRRISVVAISTLSAVCNNAMQTLIASLIAGVDFVLMFPFTAGASIIAGAGVGVAVWLIVRLVPERLLLDGTAVGSKEGK